MHACSNCSILPTAIAIMCDGVYLAPWPNIIHPLCFTCKPSCFSSAAWFSGVLQIFRLCEAFFTLFYYLKKTVYRLCIENTGFTVAQLNGQISRGNWMDFTSHASSSILGSLWRELGLTELTTQKLK